VATVLHVPAFEDNYIWLLADDGRRRCALVDPGDADAAEAGLAAHGLAPVAILCTHHHRDHTGGIETLCRRHPGLAVYGPARERIPAMSHPLADGARVELAALGLALAVLDVPGHTAGHIAFVGDGALFCGDTLFSAGCGRLFEGTPAQMHASLARLAALPEDTAVYCAHEYTADGLRFAAAVEPRNADLPAYREQVRERRALDLPTLPSSIGLEKRVNPFLRTGTGSVRRAVETYCRRSLADEVEVFAELRRWKDEFRG
jgi:hydroxyacylglutathione hydrolase